GGLGGGAGRAGPRCRGVAGRGAGGRAGERSQRHRGGSAAVPELHDRVLTGARIRPARTSPRERCVGRPLPPRTLRWAEETAILPQNSAFGENGVAEVSVRGEWGRRTQRSGTVGPGT